MPDIKTGKDAIEALRQVVAGREDYVYPGANANECFNFSGGLNDAGYPSNPAFACIDDLRPSCIVGHVLALWGLDREHWPFVEGGMQTTQEALDYLARENHEVPQVDPGAYAVLYLAQMAQDQGATWGQSLRRSEGVYRHAVEEDTDV